MTGVGALAGGHRLKQVANRPELDTVKGIIDKLNKLAEEVDPAEEEGRPFHHWIADVCNYYFVVGDMYAGGAAGLNKDKRAEIESYIDQLNERLVKTPPHVLSEICKKGAVIAVAGGPHKVSAIRHVLSQQNRQQNRQQDPWVSHLVTDSDTAKALVNDFARE